MKKLINMLIAGSLLFASACATVPQQVQVQTVEVPRAKIELPEPRPIKMDEVKWTIIKTKDNQVLFTLTDTGFKNLMVNMTKMKESFREEKSLVQSYKTYYEGK